MKEIEFLVLRCLAEKKSKQTLKDIARDVGGEICDVENIVRDFVKCGFVNEFGEILPQGLDQLEPYRVDNAVILAAGMSTRFAPFSFERPKGLTVVKGEVLIERQIRQLKEAGVKDIILVLGHMMEKFLYLAEKYDAKIVINSEYKHKNTHSSVYFAREYLKNTYVCCADNYFPQSVFHKYEYHSLYSVLYMEGEWPGERGVTTDSTGLIVETQRPAVDQWVMNGYAYYDNSFSQCFKGILEEIWNTPGTESLYWEQVYAANVEKLPLYAVKYTDKEVMEFDSVAELEAFDPDFIKYNELNITKNICNTIGCNIDEIHNIRPMTKGYTNKSFSFDCREQKYIYRNPGIISSEWIDRRVEKTAQTLASNLGVDKSYLFMDENEGWKISKYIEVTEPFSFSSEKHLEMLCDKLRIFYSSPSLCGRKMDFIVEAKKMLEKIRIMDRESYDIASEMLGKYEKIDLALKADGWPVQISHNDLYEENILVYGDELAIIDWEYAGDADIGYDICKIIVKNDALGEEAKKWLSFYYSRVPTSEEFRHIVGCAAVSFYYWYIWAIYMTKCGNDYTDLILKYYSISKKYCEEFIFLSKNKD